MIVKKYSSEINPDLYDELLKNSDGNLKKNIEDFTYKYKLTDTSVYEFYKDEKLVGSAKINNSQNHISLYNIFSIKPGVGTLLLNKIWEDAFNQNIKYYRVWVYYDAIKFYDKFNFKYWDYHVNTKCLFAFGNILNSDPKISNTHDLEQNIVDHYSFKNIKRVLDKCDISRDSMKTRKHEPMFNELIKDRKRIFPDLIDKFFV